MKSKTIYIKNKLNNESCYISQYLHINNRFDMKTDHATNIELCDRFMKCICNFIYQMVKHNDMKWRIIAKEDDETYVTIDIGLLEKIYEKRKIEKSKIFSYEKTYGNNHVLVNIKSILGNFTIYKIVTTLSEHLNYNHGWSMKFIENSSFNFMKNIVRG